MISGFAIALVVQSANLEVMSTGAMPVIGGYRPQRLQLTSELPSGLKASPRFHAPLYGVLTFGGAAAAKSFVVVVDGDKLYVDANGNGEVTVAEAAAYAVANCGDGNTTPTWDGGCPDLPIGMGPVSVQPATWGRVKSAYR